DRPGMSRVIVGHRALAGDRLHNRNSTLDREIRNDISRQRIAHAAAGDEDRLPRGPEQRSCFCELLTVRARTRNGPGSWLEKSLGVVEGYLLGVLWQREKGRAAVGRIEHRGHGLRERRDDLRGMSDPIPVARDRLERVVHSDGRVAKMLDLLE